MRRSTKEPDIVMRGPAAVWMPIDELITWSDNPRKNDHAVDQVAESIKRFGFATPVTARKENNEIIAGHTRVKAAKSLGLQKVPVRFLDLDENAAHALAIADNYLNEVSVWDDTKLEPLLEELEAELAGIYDFCEDENEEEDVVADSEIDEPEENEEETLLDKLNQFVARSEQKQRKIWGKADHKALLGIAEELRAAIG